MSLNPLVEEVKSGVVHIVYVKNQKKIGSGSGFILNGYLVTNNHVIQTPENTNFLIRFHNSDPKDLSDGLLYKHDDFLNFLATGSDVNSFDFAVFDIPKIRKNDLFSFDFGEVDKMKIGDNIAFLGYPLEHNNLVVHNGMISSFYNSGPSNTEIIQLDASVNASNSGGPLVDISTGNVIGIITRKATGLSMIFEELRDVLDKNIAQIKQAKGMIWLGGFNPVSGFIAGQNQLKSLTNEIERSANVGIGYAVSIKHLAQDNLFHF
jgi:S1-C subfamily serine protease